MNGQNLLIGLSHIDRKFIEESENDTVSGMKGTYEKSGQGRKVFRKPLLIAAIIAQIFHKYPSYRKRYHSQILQ